MCCGEYSSIEAPTTLLRFFRWEFFFAANERKSVAKDHMIFSVRRTQILTDCFVFNL